MALRIRPSLRTLLLLLFGVIVSAGAIVLPSVFATIRRGATASRLQYIQTALLCYHESFGCYPPQYILDQKGQPAHSWRVLLLPYLGYDELYQQYDFDEPWNGTHNRLLMGQMPVEYRSPFLDSDSTISQYVAIVGENTLWHGATPLRDVDTMSRNAAGLVWFVECANSNIEWMEPRDVPLEQALLGIGRSDATGVQTNYSDGLPAQLYPGGVRWIPVGTPSDLLRAMLTVESR
jgi:hypothetical protein